jgi:hypothetical protein
MRGEEAVEPGAEQRASALRRHARRLPPVVGRPDVRRPLAAKERFFAHDGHELPSLVPEPAPSCAVGRSLSSAPLDPDLEPAQGRGEGRSVRPVGDRAFRLGHAWPRRFRGEHALQSRSGERGTKRCGLRDVSRPALWLFWLEAHEPVFFDLVGTTPLRRGLGSDRRAARASARHTVPLPSPPCFRVSGRLGGPGDRWSIASASQRGACACQSASLWPPL